MDYIKPEEPAFGAEDPYAPPPNKRPRDSAQDSHQGSGSTYAQDEVTELKEKVFIPVKKYPGYNFVGSLLGPQGTILKGLQKATNAKISIYGRGSMRDKNKEEELFNGDDPDYAHLKEPLHVLIEVKAPRAEAHFRVSNALVEVYKFMVPPSKRDERYGGGGGVPYSENQGGGALYNEGPYDPYAEEGYGGNYMEGGGAPVHRGGGMGGRPRGAAPTGGAPRGGAPRGGAPRGGAPRGGAPRGGGPQDRGAPRGGGPQDYGAPRGRGGPQRGAGRGAPPQGTPPAGRGVNRPLGGARVPPQQAADPYSNTEPTNYQWHGNYSNNSRTADAGLSTSNGFTLKRFHDSYDDSY